MPIEDSKIPKISRLRRASCAAGIFLRLQETTNGILHSKMSAAGENFTVSEHYKGNFTVQNERHRRTFYDFRMLQRGFYHIKWAPQAKILRFQGATGAICLYKIGAADENFGVSKRYRRYFTLQNERRRRKFPGFKALQMRFYLTKWAP